jgi:Replication-relaxation
MRVTDRDRRMIVKLAAARWLTTAQIAALSFAGLTPEMARRRIRLLREARYIRSVQSNAMAEALHTLGPRGPELLGEHRAACTRLERAVPKNFSHLAGINTIRVAVERSARAEGITLKFFFASWELQAHGWKLPVIPDAACRVEAKGKAATVLFEYDRGEERPSYLLRTKFAHYREQLASFPFSHVVIVAETAGLRDRLHAYLGEHLPSPLFSFVAKEALMEAWSVSGLLS